MLGQHPVDAADDSSNRVLWVIRQVINGFPVVVQDIAAQIHNAHMHVVTLQHSLRRDMPQDSVPG